jgi:type IV secretion system protein VirD4
MARNEIRAGSYSFQSSKEDKGYRKKAFALFCCCLVVTLQVTGQYIAHQYMHHPVLGWRVHLLGYPAYPFYRAAYWLFELMRTYEQSRSNIAAMSAFVFASGLLISAFITRAYIFNSRKKSLESIHGTAHWATLEEIREAGLLDEDDDPFPEGVVVGGVCVGRKKQVKMMRHNGREHVLCYAPTRSGKGVSLVLPTLLDGWKQSAFILDIKGENSALSAGYRKSLGHKILKLDFTDPFAIEKGTSATFNPLEEVSLDFDFPEGFIPDLQNLEKTPFEMVHSDTYNETSTIQQIVAIIIDPQGKGSEDHWGRTASSFMLGAITHLLYRYKIEGRGCPGIADVLSELSVPGEKWQSVVQGWQDYPHLGMREETIDGERIMTPITHSVVAEEAQTLLNKPAKEAGRVLSTVVSNLALFRDPVVSKNTSRSSFRIRDLMHHDSPVSLYLIVSPTDQLRLTPLTRLVITQIIFTLAGHMDFADGRSVEGYKHR